jgi:threonine/homoserine/homoserine lactone efflux protein
MALLISRGIGQGWRTAWYTALGFSLAGVIQIPLLAFGVASIFQSSALAFDVLRYFGAAYLAWRGVQLFLQAASLPLAQPSTPVTRPTAALRDGVVASLTNPKSLIFLLAFLPQFVDPSAGSIPAQLVLLGLLMKAVALTIETAIALCADRVGRVLRRLPQVLVWQGRMTGVLMLGLAIRLVTMNSEATR